MADMAALGRPTCHRRASRVRARLRGRRPAGTAGSSRRGREWLEVIGQLAERASRAAARPAAGAAVVHRRAAAHRCRARRPGEPRRARRYDWTFDAPRFIRGTRPDAVRVAHRAGAPGWFLGDGWALTPELAGLARRDGGGPGARSARRRCAPARGSGGARDRRTTSRRPPPTLPSASTCASTIGALDTWESRAGPFLRVVSLPAGTLVGRRLRPADRARPRPRAARRCRRSLSSSSISSPTARRSGASTRDGTKPSSIDALAGHFGGRARRRRCGSSDVERDVEVRLVGRVAAAVLRPRARGRRASRRQRC